MTYFSLHRGNINHLGIGDQMGHAGFGLEPVYLLEMAMLTKPSTPSAIAPEVA
jgi:hypothetical protein